MPSVSIKDIALSLNLSKATVSWILSGQGETKGFSSDTIKLVKEYAAKVDYQPNLLARSLSVGSTFTIGLIVPFIADTFYAQIAQAVEAEAEKNQYVVTICTSEGDSEHEIKQIQTLRSKQVDGLIIAPTRDSGKEIRKMAQDRFPFVLIDRFFPEIDTSYIVVDNEPSSYKLVSHLIKKGCKKIAMLTSDSHLLVMRFRMDGYKRALAEVHQIHDEKMLLEINREDYKNDIITQLDKLLTEEPDTDAFFFATHYLALEAFRYFMNKGIDYQNRFRFACFHEMEALDVLAPKMSVSRMPVERLGKESVELLIHNIKQKELPCSKRVIENQCFLRG